MWCVITLLTCCSGYNYPVESKATSGGTVSWISPPEFGGLLLVFLPPNLAPYHGMPCSFCQSKLFSFLDFFAMSLIPQHVIPESHHSILCSLNVTVLSHLKVSYMCCSGLKYPVQSYWTLPASRPIQRSSRLGDCHALGCVVPPLQRRNKLFPCYKLLQHFLFVFSVLQGMCFVVMVVLLMFISSSGAWGS